MEITMKNTGRRIAVIGGGASGCMAAVAAARAGCSVTIFEKNEKICKKIYATGNGRCNLTNLFLDRTCYHTSNGKGEAVLSFIHDFSQEDLIRFFKEQGVPVHDRDKYVYPRTDQAETIARALENCLRDLGVKVVTDCTVDAVEDSTESREDQAFRIRYRQITCEKTTNSSKKKNRVPTAKGGAKKAVRTSAVSGIFDCSAVILCTGGMAGPSFGCCGDGYRLARSFSHSIVSPLPALTRLECDSPVLKRAAGVRCHASITLFEDLNHEEGQNHPDNQNHPDVQDGQGYHDGQGDQDGQCDQDGQGNQDYQGKSGTRGQMRRIACEDGELQITQNSISGIPVFQLSGEAARLLDCGRRVRVQINFLPEFSEEEFDKETAFRLQIDRNRMLGDLLLGLAHRKVIDLILAEEGLQAEMKAARLSENRLRSIIYRFRKFETGITGTGGFDHAQVTAGGVPLEEMDASFASKKRAGLYFAGELIDVDGRCGGYNLQWAMTSGVLAGRAAGRYVSDKNDG